MRWPEAGSAVDRVMVRAGVPHPSSPDLLEMAREHSIPILVSANAFSRTSVEASTRGEPWTFREPSALLKGLDVALDSGGFVAQARYNGYLWTIDEYLDLVASHDWTWWAAMDLCQEPEIAGSRIERRLRIAQTTRNWLACAERARDRGLSDPLPVLQGQGVEDYLVAADLMPVMRWPALIGIGSMCRRDLSGPDNIEAVLNALDRVLPPSTSVHLFGIKSAALDVLADHPRVASTDSCAWSYDLRRKLPVGRSRSLEAQAMLRWWLRQRQRLADPRPPASRPFWAGEHVSADDPLTPALERDLREWVDLVASGEADLHAAWQELSVRAAYTLGPRI